MSDVDPRDVQGFVLRGYNLPVARYLFLNIVPGRGGLLVERLIPRITTGQHWDIKPPSTLNMSFTYTGLVNLGLPTESLLSFPAEYVQGMKERRDILCDVGKSAPENWDPLWKEGSVNTWLGIMAANREELERAYLEVIATIVETEGAIIVGFQDLGSEEVNGRFTMKEHFGYSDGFGNPDYLGINRSSQPGQGKLTIEGNWEPIATGELLFGYRDEAGELPVAPVPKVFSKNGTFMVYRKLHQNVRLFREYLDQKSVIYGGGKEKLAAKIVGRWRDGTPIELSPDSPDPSIVHDPNQNTNFTFEKDLDGQRCPLGAHIRRANPRDALGFRSRLADRRRITRRGLPYGAFVSDDDGPVWDEDERGIGFLALNVSIARQFEYVCQQWVEDGNDLKQGRDKDVLVGNHEGHDSFMIQGSSDPLNPPFVCVNLPNFVELRGGDYFFVPSMTALRMLATRVLD